MSEGNLTTLINSINEYSLYAEVYHSIVDDMGKIKNICQNESNKYNKTIGMENINIIANIMMLQRIDNNSIDEKFEKLVKSREYYFKCYDNFVNL